MGTLLAYLQLMRPANIVTAIADILLGYAVSGAVVSFWGTDSNEIVLLQPLSLMWLVLSTIGLYGGGVVMNDVFDLELDQVERPERPIPSGRASLSGATLLGISLLIFGIVMAAQVSVRSAIVAGIVGFLAVLYDAFGKHHTYLGPINMGACRGGNLLLGMSVLPFSTFSFVFALIPIIYIGAITTISRGEVHGENKRELWTGFFLYLIVVGITQYFTIHSLQVYFISLPFGLLFVYLIFPPLIRALRDPKPQHIGQAVKAGVISLIVLDALLAVSFAGWVYALLILMLLPLSFLLARVFSVT